MSLVVGFRDKAVGDVGVRELLRELVHELGRRVVRVRFIDGDEGRVVAHCTSALTGVGYSQ